MNRCAECHDNSGPLLKCTDGRWRHERCRLNWHSKERRNRIPDPNIPDANPNDWPPAPPPPKNTAGDMKEALSSGRKPDISHTRTALMVYIARGCEYGDKTQGGKYERANYLRPTNSVKEDFVRLRTYLRAATSHISQTLDALERHLAIDPNLEDTEGMLLAAYAVDTDAAPGCPVGASYLPHLCGAAASLNMAITQAVEAGLIPADPGQPWRKADREGK